jgi:acid ceramidase
VGRNQHGQLLHGRNLDYGTDFGTDNVTHQYIFTELLQNMTINVNFMRNGTSLFKGTTYAGYAGVLNGVKGTGSLFSTDISTQMLNT